LETIALLTLGLLLLSLFMDLFLEGPLSAECSLELFLLSPALASDLPLLSKFCLVASLDLGLGVGLTGPGDSWIQGFKTFFLRH